MVSFENFSAKKTELPFGRTITCSDWTPNANLKKHLCLFSAIFAFSIGLFVGILIPVMCFRDGSAFNARPTYLNRNVSIRNDIKNNIKNNVNKDNDINNNSAVRVAFEEFEIKNVFLNNSFGFNNSNNKNVEDEFSTVSFVENFDGTDANYNSATNYNGFVEDGIFWSRKVEDSIPKGFNEKHHNSWRKFVNGTVAVKLENGCGRMQNRLVTFENGFRGCIRYRQNIDQIQGELFSFYLGQILKLHNLAPSLVTVVNLKDPLFKNIIHDVATAQWNSNKPIVLTQFIANLDAANIPIVFKNNERHLNKLDVKNMIENAVDRPQLLDNMIELAQWSDLILFDYLTANLDRVVNNLFNYQWNVNIMEAPAHNLAKNSNTNLLVFLDNESGLLHGYRLLQKYEKYHSVLLDNLCVFRRQTVDIIKGLRRRNDVGALLKEMFDRNNDDRIKDVLPTLPDKSVKILNERIEKVHSQILKCESSFSESVVR